MGEKRIIVNIRMITGYFLFICNGSDNIFIFFQLSYFLCQYPYFVCPMEYSEAEDSLKYTCDASPIFIPQEYHLPETLANFSALVSGRALLLYYDIVKS